MKLKELSEQEIANLPVGTEVVIHYWKNNPRDVRIKNVRYVVRSNEEDEIEFTVVNDDDDADWIVSVDVCVENGKRIALPDLGGKGHLTIKRVSD